MKWTCLCLALFLISGTPLLAQDPEEIETTTPAPTDPTPSEEITVEENGESPLDDVVKKEIMLERKVLAYQPIRESDIFWEKRV